MLSGTAERIFWCVGLTETFELKPTKDDLLLCDELDAVLLENLENLKQLMPLHMIGVTATCEAAGSTSCSIEASIFEHTGFLVVDERGDRNHAAKLSSTVGEHEGLSSKNMELTAKTLGTMADSGPVLVWGTVDQYTEIQHLLHGILVIS